MTRRLIVACLSLAVAIPAAAAPTSAVAAAPPAQPRQPSQPTEPAAAAIAIPAAGSVTASPATDITLRGVSSASIAVEGERSGGHTGTIVAHPDGDGVTFRPDTPLQAGEAVTVTTDADVAGAKRGSYSFRVGVPANHPGVLANGELATPRTAAKAQAANDRAAAATLDQQRGGATPSYKTRPDLNPPTVTINQAASGTAPGFIMATPIPTQAGTQGGSMLYNNRGELVWFRPGPRNLVVGDLKRVTYRGQPALTWFEGIAPYAPGNYRGQYLVVDESYSRVARIQMGNGYQADIHDVKFTGRGTVYLIAYNPLVCDNVTITPCTTGATVLEAVLQEVDPESGTVLFEWHSLDHVPLTDSYLPNNDDPFDYIHPNSVDVDLDGNVLMSARNTSALYKINRTTGALMFTLGGKSSDFTYVDEIYDPPTFRGPDLPHDFRALPDGRYSYFDNGVLRAAGVGGAPPVQRSRGAIVDLDLAAGEARYDVMLHRPATYNPIQGRMQRLPGGHYLVSWAGLGIITEFDASRAPIFDASLNANTYRQVRQRWSGAPDGAPRLAVAGAANDTRLWVSWNGDTRTARWRLLAGRSPSSLSVVRSVPRDGFETTFKTAAIGPFYAVEALDASGTVLRRSAAVRDDRWFGERGAPPVSGTYRPVVGDFGGSRNDDIFYYAPGTNPDYVHVSNDTGGFDSVPMPPVTGDYRPQAGDYIGDDRDEILWWNPAGPPSYMWRFDRNPRSTLDIAPQSAELGSLPSGSAIRPIVLDHHPNAGGSPDEVFWFGVGSAPDRVDRFTWNGGSPLTVVSRAVSIDGSYRTASGDFDNNGLADVFFHAPGAAVDGLWLTTGGPGGSTGQRSFRKSIQATTTPVAGNFAGGRADEILFWRSGSGADTAWTFSRNGSHTVTRATTSRAGTPYALRSDHDIAMIRASGGPVIWQLDGGSRYTPSRNNPLARGARPLIGDFVGGGGIDSVLWYRPGTGAERLYVGR